MHREGTYHKNKVAQSRRMSFIFRYVRVALATTGVKGPPQTRDLVVDNYLWLDCEQSLFFSSRSFSSVFFSSATRARERQAAKPRDARNEGGSPRRERETL